MNKMFGKNSLYSSKFIVFVVFVLLSLFACKNDDEQFLTEYLPLITESGENTIGCIVNEALFVNNSQMINSYELIDGEYFLTINWQQENSGSLKTGQIKIKRTEIFEDEVYLLKSDSEETDYSGGSASYTYNDGSNSKQYRTNVVDFGGITFTRFDIVNNIMSGVFSFQARDISSGSIHIGEIIDVIEGRFDLTFTN
jgi:hypothetical protein